jgi:hypothetical protein
MPEPSPSAHTSNPLSEITLHATNPLSDITLHATNPLSDITLHATGAPFGFNANNARIEPHDHTEELLSALVNPSSASQDPSTPPPFAMNGMSPTSTPPSSTRIPKQDLPTQQPYTQIPEQKESAYLLITSRGSKNPHEIKLEGDEITIGRAGTSDILLDQDTLTSRHQALLKYENGHYVLYDQRSAYGTTVNGQQLTPGKGYPLHEGDKIGIGSYELVFTRK